MMEKNYFLLVILLFLGLSATISSCSLFEPPAIIPCYGHIDSIPLIITNPSQQGTSANGINCAWVYVDDNPVGAFPLPCTFPIIATTGAHMISIFAGVENYGDAENRTKYPFYSSYILNSVTLTQGSTVKFKPTVNYANWADVDIIEDFDEGQNIPRYIREDSTSGASDTNMYIIQVPNPNVYQGNGSGLVSVNSARSHYLGMTLDTFDLTNNGNAVYLEINYKTNNVFTIGMINMESPSTLLPVVYVDTSSTWKKMYINLTPTISASPAPTYFGYEIYFEVKLENGVSLGQAYFDNIKLVRYN
ncbi:MAG: hypothetical protein ACLQQ4_04465 [Bacteroidia bacterium]